MTRKPDLRSILEPEVPRLSAEAAARLDAAVGEALEGKTRRPRPFWRPALVAAPALLLALLAFLWLRPGDEQADYFLMSEEELVSALESWEEPQEVFEALKAVESSTPDFSDVNDTADWNDSDWEAFRQDLEELQLSDNGGES